ncbi:glycosyltransferase family 4 protein [Planctomycetota bacterium]
MKFTNNIERILYLCGGRNFCSRKPSRKLAEVANCWRRAGHEVKHVCGGDLACDPVYAGGRGTYVSQEAYTRWCRRFPSITPPLVTSMSEWRDIRHDRRMLEHLHNVAREWRPTVVWERSCRLHCAGLEIAKLLHVPYVLEWKDHLIDYRFSILRGRALRLEVRKNRDADYIVVESEVLRDKLANKGVNTQKIIVAHNAVNPEEFCRDEEKRKRVRQEFGTDDDTVLVGYLGSYAFYHDAARLVLAAKMIRRRNTAPTIKILMVGVGKEYPRSRRIAEKLGLLDDILIMKPGVPKDEVPSILAALDIAVLPDSTDIICPIKVQEYMACELPSVVPDYTCNREVLREGETGVFFKPKDEAALAEQIVLLAINQKLRERIGRCAREDVIHRFSWEVTWGAALQMVLDRQLTQ